MMRERPSYPVILDSLQGLSDQDKSMQAIEIILGGTDTSAFTLGMGIFRILGSSECTRKLVTCLDEHISKSGVLVPLVDLERIDYLVSITTLFYSTRPKGRHPSTRVVDVNREVGQWAVVKECLRIAMPIRGRLPRVVPQDAPPLVVDGKVVPPGVCYQSFIFFPHVDNPFADHGPYLADRCGHVSAHDEHEHRNLGQGCKGVPS